MQSPFISSSETTLYIPGQWPLEDGFAAERDDLCVSHNNSFITTVGKWVAIVADISTLFTLPHDFARKFLRRQKIAIVPILGENGSSKKRLIDAGFVNEVKKTITLTTSACERDSTSRPSIEAASFPRSLVPESKPWRGA